MSIDYCPVVYPTWAEFNDFHAYTEYLEKTYASQYGIIKVSYSSLRLYHPKDGRLLQKVMLTLTQCQYLALLNKMPTEEVEFMNVSIFQINQ